MTTLLHFSFLIVWFINPFSGFCSHGGCIGFYMQLERTRKCITKAYMFLWPGICCMYTFVSVSKGEMIIEDFNFSRCPQIPHCDIIPLCIWASLCSNDVKSTWVSHAVGHVPSLPWTWAESRRETFIFFNLPPSATLPPHQWKPLSTEWSSDHTVR